MGRFGFVLLLCCGAAFCQRPRPAPASPPQAASPAQTKISDAQAINVFNAVSQHMARLEPMLEQVRVKDWAPKGAPEAYVQQLASTTAEIRGIQDDMTRLAQRPAQMQECMRALFRVQAVHVPLSSLMAGLRKYQNPALADLIEAVAAEDETQVAQFERYVLQLADDKDQQYQIVDSEAQRCRATLSREPAPPRSRSTHNQ